MHSRKTIVKQNSFCSEHFYVPRGCRASSANNIEYLRVTTQMFSVGRRLYTCPHSTDSECVHFREKAHMGDKMTDCMFVLCILKSLYSKLFGFSFFFFRKVQLKMFTDMMGLPWHPWPLRTAVISFRIFEIRIVLTGDRTKSQTLPQTTWVICRHEWWAMVQNVLFSHSNLCLNYDNNTPPMPTPSVPPPSLRHVRRWCHKGHS